jgi:hypothetical protein
MTKFNNAIRKVLNENINYWNLAPEEILRLTGLTDGDMQRLKRAKDSGASLSHEEENMVRAYFPFKSKKDGKWYRKVLINGVLKVRPV